MKSSQQGTTSSRLFTATGASKPDYFPPNLVVETMNTCNLKYMMCHIMRPIGKRTRKKPIQLFKGASVFSMHPSMETKRISALAMAGINAGLLVALDSAGKSIFAEVKSGSDWEGPVGDWIECIASPK